MTIDMFDTLAFTQCVVYVWDYIACLTWIRSPLSRMLWGISIVNMIYAGFCWFLRNPPSTEEKQVNSFETTTTNNNNNNKEIQNI